MPSPGTPPVIHLRFLKGTEAEIFAAAAASTFDEGEPIYATDTQRLFVATGPNNVVPIGPSTALSLSQYFHLPSNNVSTGDNLFEGASRFHGQTSFGTLITSTGSVEKWPNITSLSGSTTTILPLTDNSTRLATTEWVKQVLNDMDMVIPEGVAWRTQPNTFTHDNIFNLSPLVPTPTPTDSSTKAANTQWVRNYVDSREMTGVAYVNRDNIFTAATTHDFRAASLLAATSSATFPTVEVTDSRVATLGWIKREIAGIGDIRPLNNTFTGTNAFTTSPTGPTPASGDNSNKFATTAFVTSLFNSMGSTPTVYLGATYNQINWDAGEIRVGGNPVQVAAGSLTLPTTNGTYYIAASNTGTVNYSTTPVSDGLMATVQINNGQTSIFVPATGIDVTDFVLREGMNTIPATNTFTGTNTFGTTNWGDTSATFRGTYSPTQGFSFGKAMGDYTIPAEDSSKILATTEWVQALITNGSSSFWEAVTGSTTGQTLKPLSTIGEVDLTAQTVKARHPVPDADNNEVATTKWVNDLLSERPTYPVVSYPGSGLTVIYTPGTVIPPEEAACNACVDGRCVIGAGSVPITTATRYVWVRYSDCAVIASETAPATLEGKVIALVNATGTPIEVTPISSSTWAPVDNPVFTGTPQGPTPPAEACDNQLATTGWVCDKIEGFLHEPCDGVRLPYIYNVIPTGATQSLLINVTDGEIMKPDNTRCIVRSLSEPVALVANTTEFVWIRYSDCKLVASTTHPGTAGFVLATVQTSSSAVTNIMRAANASIETAFSKNYVVGYGGRLIYVGPVSCGG